MAPTDTASSRSRADLKRDGLDGLCSNTSTRPPEPPAHASPSKVQGGARRYEEEWQGWERAHWEPQRGNWWAATARKLVKQGHELGSLGATARKQQPRCSATWKDYVQLIVCIVQASASSFLSAVQRTDRGCRVSQATDLGVIDKFAAQGRVRGVLVVVASGRFVRQ